MNTLIITEIGIIFTSLILGLVVLSRNPRSTQHRAYVLFSFSTVVWVAANIFSDHGTSYDIQLLATRIAYVAAVIVVYATLLLVEQKRTATTVRTIADTAVGVGLVLTALTPLVIRSIQINEDYSGVVVGPLYPAYLFALVVLALRIIWVFVIARRVASPRRKTQLDYMTLGIAVSVIWAAFWTVIVPGLTGDWQRAQIGPPGVFFFLLLSAYAIIKHRLFDIRSVFLRATSYSLFIALVVLIYSIVVGIFAGLALGGRGYSTIDLIMLVISAVLIGTAINPLRRLADTVTHKLFHQEKYDEKQLLDELGDNAANIKAPTTLLRHTIRIIRETMKLTNVTIILQPPSEAYVSTDRKKISQDARSLLIEYAQNDSLGDVIVLDELSEVEQFDTLRDQGLALVARLRSEGKTLGVIVLGHKQNGKLFDTKDINVLGVIADELAIALQNSLLFDEVQSLNDSLQSKIDEATSELTASNKKLQQLDQSKDEFISMASHQLRTPLTSVKGYISMVLDGDLGEVSPQQRKALEEAYTSSQRMVYLIGDFLNVSRLQTGKFELERARVSLPNIIAEEIEQLKATAKTRGIELAYTPPETFPILAVDENKMRQVMMNFIDNAIYYSPTNTTITISVQKHAHHVTFRVQDQGIGVPASERHRLFTKFYRASNAKKQRPDSPGIGLFMAKKVIVAHGGVIIFETTEGKGSTFGFRLPLEAKK